MSYSDLPLDSAYELLNPGGLILLSTRSEDGRYDLAPLSWNCPLDYDPVSKLLLVCDTGHKTFEDLVESGEFVVSLPTQAQRRLIEQTGSVSGRDHDKFEEFGIAAFKAEKVDALIPEGVAAWLECRLIRVVIEGSSGIVMGEVHRAASRSEAWKERLHYVREGLWYGPGPAQK